MGLEMGRATNIIKNDEYNKCIKSIKAYEKNRKFCKHNKKHFFDVARIAYILKLERNLDINKEILYAAALLHDIGRFLQYESKVPHDVASAEIAAKILEQCNFTEEEINEIVTAIKEHRKKDDNSSSLGKIIYEADKLSRNCFSCKATSKCNWEDDKKNLKIKY
jgi:putative nucleotidyltransferase with HDIG domain